MSCAQAAFDRLRSYVVPHRKRLLVVEDNDIERTSIVELLRHDDIDITSVGTGAEALAAIEQRDVDCCILDLALPDMSGFEVIERLQSDPQLRDTPVVVFTGKDLNPAEEERLREVAKSIVLKDVQSPERLFDETALFLHRVVADLPPEQQEMLERLHGSNSALESRKVLVVDDDVRNIFALTTLLENQDMEVLSATDGRQAIDLIQSTPDLSVVLMDIMMPDMDGYETMRKIRLDPRFRTLPIVALTARAMKGDRERCLAAGMNHCLTKPLQPSELIPLVASIASAIREEPAARDVAPAFDANGFGTTVNSSRGIIFAHARKDLAQRFAPADWQRAVEAATREMIEQLRADTPAGRLATSA